MHISVIIPTHKRPELLKAAIHSVLRQTCSDFELIVVDDDPAMSARVVALSFADPRIIYLAHHKAKGGSAARNTGLGRARGRFVAFLDDDDTWRESFLSRMSAALAVAGPDVGVVACDVEFIGKDGARCRNHASTHRRGHVFEAMLCGERAIVGTVALVRREVFNICGGFDEALPSAQDWDMWIRASKRFSFDHLDEVLADVRDYGERISSDPLRPIASRMRILEKYAGDFDQYPQARIILLKRLGKLNALIGRWVEAWRWFRQAAQGHPAQWWKILAWVLLQRPLAVAHGQDPRGPWYAVGVLALALILTAYSQLAALRSMFVVNDDMCQHIWWMRLWRSPGLFTDDLLAQYAQSLQHAGSLVLYKTISFFVDPVAVVKWWPFIFFPLASWSLYRWVLAWTREPYAAFLSATAFMVTPIYMQHMTGGHAHTFGYPLLLLFLYAFTAEKYHLAGGVMVVASLFFPIIFVLAGGYWAYAFCRREEGGLVWRGPAAGERMLGFAFLTGSGILLLKFIGLCVPSAGSILSSTAISRMPELGASGRWEVWPVKPVWLALVEFMEKGLFIFQAGYKVSLSENWKAFLLKGHVLWAGLMLVVGMWWWRARASFSLRPVGILLAVSVLFYALAAMLMLKLYAPDRYVAYTITLMGLVGVMIPAGVTVARWPNVFWRRILKAVVVVVVLAWAPLMKNAGLKDYGQHERLYAFLATLPEDALIAAYPDTADGIPLFSQRKVFINAELSVPLFDRYWEMIRARTFDFFTAYYASDGKVVKSFCHRNGITHIIIERHRFSRDFLKAKMYFEPFGSWIKKDLLSRRVFYLEGIADKGCVFSDKDVCVVVTEKMP